MMKINPSRLRSVLFMIVLIFSLFGSHGQATAKTVQERNLASGVPYNVGDVFVALSNGTVKHFTPDAVLLDTLATGTGTDATGMTFDVTGNLYVTNFFADSLSKFDNHGNLLGPFANGLAISNPESVVIDAAGDIYIGYAVGNLLNQRLLKFNANGSQLFAFSPARENAGVDWIDLAADQCTLLYTSEGSLVKRFDVCNNTQLSDFAALPISGEENDRAFAFRIRSNGEVLVVASLRVFRLNAVGAIIQIYPLPAGELSSLFALTLDPDSTSFWTAGLETGNVYKIDIASGAILKSFNVGNHVGGLAVFGEPRLAPPQLILQPVTDTKMVGETVQLAAFLTNCLNTNVFVTFTVTGANPQTGTGLASCDQIITGFTYTGNNPGTDTIVATAHTTQPPANLTSNTSTIIWNVSQDQADLSITKSDAPDPVIVGSNLTYTLTVTNNGPTNATGVTVTDTLPAGVTFVPATSNPGCTELGGVVTCALGDLANGASSTVTINITVDSGAVCGSSLTNTAVVEGNESDPDSSNNMASADTTVSCPDVSCPILDDFNRANGPLGSNWDGRTSGYRILNQQVAVRSGGPIYWQPEAYGPNQEACVTLTRINPKSKQHGLLLKVQELNDWRQGAILVSYNARTGNVVVEARDVSNHQWIQVGVLTPPMPVVDGDQLRAKAFADGTVEVLINDTSIGTADAGSFYADKGGQIGLWFRGRGGDDDDGDDDNDDRLLLTREKEEDDDDDSAALSAWLDDFGGGTLLAP